MVRKPAGNWEQLGNRNARTPGKTEDPGRPEGMTSQQHSQSSPVCKTSIPGSNPGGAAKISSAFSSPLLVYGVRWR